MSLISKNFYLYELVPRSIYDTYGDRAIQFLDPEMIKVLQFLRDKIGKPISINNWHENGLRQESGYRLPDTKTGAKLSQHKRGAAFDAHVEGMTPKEVFDFVLAHEQEFLAAGLTTMENVQFTPSWLHCDVRQTLDKTKILIVNP